jgi:fatty acid desaturase
MPKSPPTRMRGSQQPSTPEVRGKDWVVVENHSQEPAMTRKERNVARTTVVWVFAAAAVALVAVALVTRDWLFFWLALLIFVPYAFLLMWPIWLARSTQVVQRTEHRKDVEKEGPLPKP